MVLHYSRPCSILLIHWLLVFYIKPPIRNLRLPAFIFTVRNAYKAATTCQSNARILSLTILPSKDFGEQILSTTGVYEWYKDRESIEDDQDEHQQLKKIKELSLKNVGISEGSVKPMLSDHLGFRKVKSQLVSKMFHEKQRRFEVWSRIFQKRFTVSQTFHSCIMMKLQCRQINRSGSVSVDCKKRLKPRKERTNIRDGGHRNSESYRYPQKEHSGESSASNEEDGRGTRNQRLHGTEKPEGRLLIYFIKIGLRATLQTALRSGCRYIFRFRRRINGRHLASILIRWITKYAASSGTGLGT